MQIDILCKIVRNSLKIVLVPGFQKSNLKDHQRSIHEALKYPANIGAVKQITRDILQDTNSQCMKESSFHANIAAMKHFKRFISKTTKSLSMN